MSATSSRAQRLRNRMPAIDPDAPPPVVPVPSPVASKALESVPATDTAPDEEPEAPTGAPVPAARRTTPKQSPGAAADEAGEAEETDDEKVRSGYRSFYVEDDVFVRFRAAIYWSSRRHDADEDVPINMSVGVSEYMERTAAALEKRFNDGDPFKSPPVVQRKKRKRRNTEN
jgi:hypothetical protein